MESNELSGQGNNVLIEDVAEKLKETSSSDVGSTEAGNSSSGDKTNAKIAGEQSSSEDRKPLLSKPAAKSGGKFRVEIGAINSIQKNKNKFSVKKGSHNTTTTNTNSNNESNTTDSYNKTENSNFNNETHTTTDSYNKIENSNSNNETNTVIDSYNKIENSNSNNETNTTTTSHSHNTKSKKIYRQTINNFVTSPNENCQNEESRKSLYELTMELCSEGSDNLKFYLEEKEEYVNKLQQKRLLMISCLNEGIAFEAGRELINQVSIAEKHKRKLDLENLDEKNSNLKLASVWENATDEHQQTALLVVAFQDNTHNFLDSLIYSIAQTDDIDKNLREKEIFLVCITNPTQLGSAQKEKGRELHCPHWEIDFLKPLLRSKFDNYAELVSKIENQRASGYWSDDESEFHREISKNLNKGELLKLINQFESITNQENKNPESSLFIGDGSISDTALFVAAYFPDLSLAEFRQVVHALLGDKTIAVHTTAFKPGDNGAMEPYSIQKEVLLTEIWQDDADKILKRCRLEISSEVDSTKVVGFSDPAMREKVKALLESEYNFYLDKQVGIIQKQGLLFHRSSKVSEKAAQYIVDQAAFSPDDYERSWIIETIIQIESPLNPGESSDRDTAGEMSRQELSRSEKNWLYFRIAILLRAMLKHPKLTGTVKEIIEYLLNKRLHNAVSQLSKRMRFTPEFNDFSWMKQLFDKGGATSREAICDYLLFYLQNLGGEVYDKLRILQTWLPEPDCRKPSQSSLSALYLVLVYCLEITQKFDLKEYGLWPSRFPLFAGQNRATFLQDAELLMNWLFHPFIKAVWEETSEPETIDYDTLIGSLIAEWTFILRRPVEKSGNTDQEEESRLWQEPKPVSLESSEPDFDDVALIEILLERMAAITSLPQQKALIRVWQQQIQEINERIVLLLPSDDYRRERIWQRTSTRELMKQFKEIAKKIRSEKATNKKQYVKVGGLA